MARKYIPWFDIKRNRWRLRFSSDGITPYGKEKSFKTEEEAKQFVLNIFPDAYDIKSEIERKCNHCNHILPLENFNMRRKTNLCKLCISIYNKKYRHNKKDNNICTHCNKLAFKNSILCFDHWFRDVSRRHFKTNKYANELIHLWEKQNRRCVYSNVELIPADNMSLDHIVSKYDNPDLAHDFNNVQWVHKDINNMKFKFSHDAFITLCKYISQKFS